MGTTATITINPNLKSYKPCFVSPLILQVGFRIGFGVKGLGIDFGIRREDNGM